MSTNSATSDGFLVWLLRCNIVHQCERQQRAQKHTTVEQHNDDDYKVSIEITLWLRLKPFHFVSYVSRYFELVLAYSCENRKDDEKAGESPLSKILIDEARLVRAIKVQCTGSTLSPNFLPFTVHVTIHLTIPQVREGSPGGEPLNNDESRPIL